MKRKKQPKKGVQLEFEKASKRSVVQRKFTWSVDSIELDGPFGWDKICIKHFFKTVLVRFKNFETMYWSEIEGPDHHPIQVVDICKKAQKRLEEITLDIRELFSLRITGKQRVLGYQQGNVFHVLWWDPHHQVCPSKKKHT